MTSQRRAAASQPLFGTLLLFAGLSFAMPGEADDRAAQAFEQLRTLAGDWQGRSASGRAFQVTYKLSAAGTVLVETWAPRTEHESVTVYHLHHDDLIATHYCLQGNQPRLQLAAPAAAGIYVFSFLDATNLQSPADSHLHTLELELASATVLHRTDTYVEGGKPDSQRTTFTRLAAP